jgi:ribosomal protein S18 acetylase RimI-like enzyme
LSSDAIQIRSAREADLAAIVALLADDPLGREREQDSDPLPFAYRQAFSDMEEQLGNRMLVAEQEGVLIGCLQLTVIAGLSRRGAKRAQIEAVRVGSAWRGQGVGERLVRHAITLARAAGCCLVQLTTDKSRNDAHRFYEGLGFTASHIGMKLNIL